MRAEPRGRGVIIYEKEQSDFLQEAMIALARKSAGAMGDEEAAEFGALFPAWRAGQRYRAGERISDEAGALYRVVQDHTSQEDWSMAETPALYAPMGVTAEDPGAVPEWRQPLGAQDAYHKGERVRYEGKIYQSSVDGNVWAPGVSGWTEVTA